MRKIVHHLTYLSPNVHVLNVSKLLVGSVSKVKYVDPISAVFLSVQERNVSQFWPRAIALADEQALLPVRKSGRKSWDAIEWGARGKGTAVVLISFFLFKFRQTRWRSGKWVGSEMVLEIGKSSLKFKFYGHWRRWWPRGCRRSWSW